MPKCYMCDAKSSSNEHTPPKSFFPKNNRNNLITVRACKLHNEDTSRDDEYARNIITMSIENNQTATNHFFEKSLKSFKRSPALTSTILNSLKDVSYYKMEAKAFQIDRDRFDKIIRKISYALFYHEYNFTWERLLAVTTNQLKTPNMTNDHLGEQFEELSTEECLKELDFKGENPSVFQYAFIDFGPNKNDKALFMIFYEGFPFWVIPDVESDHNSFE